MGENMKDFLNKFKYYILTFFIALFVICVIYLLNNVTPFGDKSLLTIDFYHQYGPMLGELYDRIKNGMNFFYSFNMGMGLPFFRNFFNYMSSFFNIIILFVEKKDLLTSYSIIIGLKCVFSSLTMYYYLHKKFKTNNFIFISLSILYAFNSYFTAYYWNIMWLDGMVFLPLITYGIEKLIDENKPLIYIISLGMMLFSNYFIGYMLCIFSVIYFLIYLLFISKKKKLGNYIHTGLIFSVSSLLAGGLAAICLIPMYTSMSSISATSDVWPSSQYYSFTLIEFIYNHLSGVNVTVFKSDVINAPNISSSIIVLPLYLLFLFNKKIDLRCKIGYSLLLGIFILSFFWAPIDFIWHAFHVPNDLPYRYSFIYPFILIIISAYSINKIDKVNDIFVLGSFVISMLFVGSVYFVNDFIIDDKIIIVNFIVLIVWYLIYVVFKYFNKGYKYISYFSLIVVVLECIIGINNNWDISHVMNRFYSNYESMSSNLDFIKNNDDSNFYRVERANMDTFNDPSWYGYYGINAFSSMEYENLASLQYALGMPGNQINSFYYNSNTPIYNIMFNLKYIIGNVSDDNYTLFYSDAVNNNYIYKSKYSSNLMFRVNEDIYDWPIFLSDALVLQNEFISNGFGISNALEIIKYDDDIIINNNDHLIHKYKLDSKSGYIYFSSNINSLLIDGILYVNDESNYYINGDDFNYYSIESMSERKVISFSDCDEIYISYYFESTNNFNAYELNYEALDDVINYIANNSVYISEFNEYSIKGYYDGDAGVIYTSIPYDDNWKVLVDGEEVETSLIGNALLSFSIGDGKHNIELKYSVPYLGVSVFISSFSLFILIIYLNKDKLYKIKLKKSHKLK